ncbi:MAG: hypothetical protein RLZZ347_566 [Candidatus Parcubacteria bacterium]|jgi:hypothetical protein
MKDMAEYMGITRFNQRKNDPSCEKSFEPKHRQTYGVVLSVNKITSVVNGAPVVVFTVPA